MWKLIKVLLNIQDKEPPAPKKPKIELHGFDLAKWHYLGISEISYNVPEDGKNIKYEARIFFFMNKKNEAIRDYTLKTNTKYLNFESHPWVTTNAEIWKVGEKEYYWPINFEPSKYLSERMKKEFGSVWDHKKKWWSSDDNAKYEIAAEEQKAKTNKIKAKKQEAQTNVIKVDFAGQEKENAASTQE